MWPTPSSSTEPFGFEDLVQGHLSRGNEAVLPFTTDSVYGEASGRQHGAIKTKIMR